MVDSLAEQRAAIALAMTNALGYTVYTGPVDDPLPQCVVIENPIISPAGAGSLMQAVWTVRILGVRVDPRAISVQADIDVPLAIQSLMKIQNYVFLGGEPRDVTESGYMLPSYIIQGSMALSFCS
jgi:hypothetical protein